MFWIVVYFVCKDDGEHVERRVVFFKIGFGNVIEEFGTMFREKGDIIEGYGIPVLDFGFPCFSCARFVGAVDAPNSCVLYCTERATVIWIKIVSIPERKGGVCIFFDGHLEELIRILHNK